MLRQSQAGAATVQQHPGTDMLAQRPWGQAWRPLAWSRGRDEVGDVAGIGGAVVAKDTAVRVGVERMVHTRALRAAPGAPTPIVTQRPSGEGAAQA